MEKYSQNLHYVLAHHGRTLMAQRSIGEAEPYTGLYYACPLCLSMFAGDTVTPNSPLLTEEHNPPQQYGGRGTVLTCKKCNEEHGATSDHLAGILTSYLPFIRGEKGASHPVRILVGKSSLKARMEVDEESKRNIIVEESNHERALQALRESRNTVNARINLSIRTPNIDRAQRAFLKIAHLEACRFFGMSYLFTENAKRIVQSLREGKRWVVNDGLLPLTLPFNGPGLYVLQADICRAYLMVVRLKVNEQSVLMGTLIPGPGDGGWSDYLKWNELVDRDIRMHCAHYDNHGLPFKTVRPDAYTAIWQKHFASHTK